MVQSQCVKEKKQTECVEFCDYKIAKNAWKIDVFCTCASCGIKKARFVKNQGN